MARDEGQRERLGYEADIHRSLWERMQTAGVPRIWAAVWLCLCLGVSLFTLLKLGIVWGLIPLGVWTLGHGVLMALTTWDGQFDDVLLAQLTRRYKSYYSAS